MFNQSRATHQNYILNLQIYHVTTTNCIRITKQELNLITQAGWSKDMTTQIPTEKHNDKAASTDNTSFIL